MPNLELLMILLASFTIAGVVKGIIGLGLPTVSLALLTIALDLPSAMAFIVVPSLLTNLWQIIESGHTKEVLKRIWLFLFLSTITVWLGAYGLSQLKVEFLSMLLGCTLIAYALINLLGFKLHIKAKNEKTTGFIAGFINGVLTGMTGSSVVPGVMYLQAIGLSKEQLLQAMGWLFSLSSLALGIALSQNQLFSLEQGGWSFFALIPSLIGMGLGKKIRKQLSEKTFKQVFFVSLLLLGLYIILR